MKGRALAEAVTKGVLTHVRVEMEEGSGLSVDVSTPGSEKIRDIVRRLLYPLSGRFHIDVEIKNARYDPELAPEKFVATGTFTAVGKAAMDAFFPGRGTEAVNKALLRVPLTSEEAFRGEVFHEVYDPKEKRWIPARPGMMCRTVDGMICAVTDDATGMAPPEAAEKDARLAMALCDALFDMLLAEEPPTLRGGTR